MPICCMTIRMKILKTFSCIHFLWKLLSLKKNLKNKLSIKLSLLYNFLWKHFYYNFSVISTLSGAMRELCVMTYYGWPLWFELYTTMGCRPNQLLWAHYLFQDINKHMKTSLQENFRIHFLWKICSLILTKLPFCEINTMHLWFICSMQ